MKGVPVARRMIAPGKEAGMYIARQPSSAAYIRSLKEPNRTSGGVFLMASRTAWLSGLTPAVREKAKVQGMPISSSRNWRSPRA